MEVIAHRGLTCGAAENSLASVAAALSAGLRLVEVDVRLSADGELFLLHDARLDRTTDAIGRLSNLSANTASSVRLSDGSPRLLDALELCASRAVLCLDVKEQQAAEPLLGQLRKSNAAVEIWSEHPTVVQRAAWAGIPAALISSGLLEYGLGSFLWTAGDLGASAVSFYPADIEPHVAAACRNASMPFMCGTPNDVTTWRTLLREGARAAITDRPLACRQMLAPQHV